MRRRKKNEYLFSPGLICVAMSHPETEIMDILKVRFNWSVYKYK
mgnify:CR=1 FL=1